MLDNRADSADPSALNSKPALQTAQNPPANAGDPRDRSLIPGMGRSPGVGNSNPRQYSCLENSMEEEPGEL